MVLFFYFQKTEGNNHQFYISFLVEQVGDEKIDKFHLKDNFIRKRRN
jgi:hypothetical protein